MSKKRYKAGKLFNKFLKLILGTYMKTLFSIGIENRQLKDAKPPYIILANHTNFWDPFLLSLCIPDPIYFVTSDAYFRNPVLKQLLKLVGAIPKRKQASDPSTIRGILEVVKSKGIIGIFPEGKRNWDGRTLQLRRATAKLIKSLDIPVYSVLLKGAYLAMPRWAAFSRRGRLSMELVKVLDKEEIKNLSPDGIYERISNSLDYDEYSSQRRLMHTYTGRNKAEHIELFLFTCAHCKGIDTLVSSKDSFECRNCGLKMHYNDRGFLEADKGAQLPFDSPRDWNLWQLDNLDTIIADNANNLSDSPITSDDNIILKTGGKTGKLIGSNTGGRLSVYCDRLEYLTFGKDQLFFPISKISGMNIQFNNQLEFIHDTVLYRFSSKSGIFSAYKYVMIVEKLRLRAE